MTIDPLSADVLPSSVCREQRGIVIDAAGLPWVRIFCANCGKDGGMVPEPSKDFAFYLCDSPCGEKWQHLMGTMVIPQEKFWEIARQEARARLGRDMTLDEMFEAEKDPNHWLRPLLRSQRDILKKR